MAGITITVDDQPVLDALARLSSATSDLSPALRDVGEHLLNTTRERFNTQTSPGGVPWAPLSPSYLARKKQNKSRILVLYDHLRGTLTYQLLPGGEGLEIGSPRIYAGTMQFGARKGAFGQTKRGSPIPWGRIPPRPFLGLSDTDKADVLDILQEHLSAAS